MPAKIQKSAEKEPLPRPDAEIIRDVIGRLKVDETVPDERIKAAVNHGILTLEGTVDWNHQRDAAENDAKAVEGVRKVVNKIAVQPAVSPGEAW